MPYLTVTAPRSVSSVTGPCSSATASAKSRGLWTRLALDRADELALLQPGPAAGEPVSTSVTTTPPRAMALSSGSPTVVYGERAGVVDAQAAPGGGRLVAMTSPSTGTWPARPSARSPRPARRILSLTCVAGGHRVDRQDQVSTSTTGVSPTARISSSTWTFALAGRGFRAGHFIDPVRARSDRD